MMTNVLDSNNYGGPFSELWEVARWVDEHDYDPDDWEFSDRERDRRERFDHMLDPEEVKRRIHNGEIDIPCGERDFDDADPEVYGWTETDRSTVEVNVIVECQQCGYKHSGSEIVVPEP